MEILKKPMNALVFGVILGASLAGTGAGPPPATAAPKESPTRVVVGLKDPLTPPVIRELKSVFGTRILNIAPGGAYALVLLRRGETLDQVQARSKRIAWVEPEVAMSATKEARMAAVVIPAPRWPKAKTK